VCKSFEFSVIGVIGPQIENPSEEDVRGIAARAGLPAAVSPRDFGLGFRLGHEGGHPRQDQDDPHPGRNMGISSLCRLGMCRNNDSSTLITGGAACLKVVMERASGAPFNSRRA